MQTPEQKKNLRRLCEKTSNSTTFNMALFDRGQDRPGCIAGHATHLWPDIRSEFCYKGGLVPNFRLLSLKVGLEAENLEDLCLRGLWLDADGTSASVPPHRISRQMAIKALLLLEAESIAERN